MEKLSQRKIDDINSELTKSKIANLPKIPKKSGKNIHKSNSANSKRVSPILKVKNLQTKKVDSNKNNFDKFKIPPKKLSNLSGFSNEALFPRTASVMITSTPAIRYRRSSTYEKTDNVHEYARPNMNTYQQISNDGDPRFKSTASKIRDILGIEKTSFDDEPKNIISPLSPPKITQRRKSIIIPRNPEKKMPLSFLKPGLPISSPNKQENCVETEQNSAAIKVMSVEKLNESILGCVPNKSEESQDFGDIITTPICCEPNKSEETQDLSHIFKNPMAGSTPIPEVGFDKSCLILFIFIVVNY